MKLAILLLSFSAALLAKTPPDGAPKRRVFAAKTAISIDHYFEDADAFEITNTAETAVGPNYATPESLQKAIGIKGPRTDFMRKKSSLIGSEHTLTQDLPLLWETEFAQRKNKKAK